MELQEGQSDCQIPSLRRLGESAADAPRASLSRRVKLAVRRRLSPGRERTLKRITNDLMNRFGTWLGKGSRPATLPTGEQPSTPALQPGDLVRVRSCAEIEATLNHWRQLKGCTFMPEMAQYCGTSQRVLKLLERFVDERDLRVKRSKGIVLLEGVLCQGTADFGRCDRSCHLFWRQEWLERIEP